MDMEDDMQESGKKLQLQNLIEKATHSTSPDIDPRLLKAIKSSVRSSDALVSFSVQILSDFLKKDHAQVRYLTLLVIDELFMRSKLFRSLLVVSFKQFLSLSVGFRRNQPLPPPKEVASLLQSKSIEFLEKWHASFGLHYRQLRSGFEYLKNTLKYQFPNRLENAARLQQERRERERRSKEILLSKFETLKGTHSAIKSEIKSTLDEIQECLDIVKVKEDEFLCMGSAEDDGVVYSGPAFQRMRLESLKEGERIHENNENSAVFDVLRELYKLNVSHHLPSLQEWISVLVRVDLEDNRYRDCILKEFIDLRNDVQAAKKRCERHGFALTNPVTEEEEDLWEEGKIETSDGQNTGMPTVRIVETGNSSTTDAGKGKAPDCTDITRKCNELVLKGDSLRERLLSEAPVVPWGSYLDNWGSKSEVLANQRGLELEGHWGRVDYDAVIPAEKIAELNVQATVYMEKQAEIRPCLAPLSKGRLCQRRDLRVCPFHGRIVPRDAEENSIAENNTLSTSVTTEENLPNYLELGSALLEQLVKKAAKNVRERERGEGKKARERGAKKEKKKKKKNKVSKQKMPPTEEDDPTNLYGPSDDESDSDETSDADDIDTDADDDVVSTTPHGPKRKSASSAVATATASAADDLNLPSDDEDNPTPAPAPLPNPNHHHQPTVSAASAPPAPSSSSASPDAKRQRISVDESRRLFQRLWTDDDEILLLQGFLDFTSQRRSRGGRGGATNHDTAPFYEQIRSRLQLDFNKNQLVEKLRRLKKKYRNTLTRIGFAKDFAFRSPHEQAAFELSRKIWNSASVEDDDDSAPASASAYTASLPTPDKPPKRRGRKRQDESATAAASAAAAAASAAASAAPAPPPPPLDNAAPAPDSNNNNNNHDGFPPSATPVQVAIPNVIEETVRSCLSPLFKELLYCVINGPCNSGIGGVALNPLPLNFSGNSMNWGSLEGGVDERWRKQQILELEVYSKRLELVQEQVKTTLEELKSIGGS